MVIRSAGTEKGLASFLDLVELYIAKELIARGMKARQLRLALREASVREGVDHPLARKKYLLHGDRLYLPIGDSIVDLGHGGQLALAEIVRQRAELLEFDIEGIAKRWWPNGQSGGVLVDPDVGYGVPVLAGTSTSTTVLHQFWISEGRNIDRVADWYGLKVQDVRQAIEYEEEIAA